MYDFEVTVDVCDPSAFHLLCPESKNFWILSDNNFWLENLTGTYSLLQCSRAYLKSLVAANVGKIESRQTSP